MNPTIDELRAGLAAQTRRGMGMPMAGLLYWVAVSLFVQLLPQKTAILASIFATGLVFPVGLLFTHLMGARLIVKEHPLNGLGGVLNAVQFFYWPVIIAVYLLVPAWTIFTLAVLFGSHFLPYGWLYRSPGYVFLAISVATTASVVALLVGEGTHYALPPLVATLYALTCVLLWRENGRPQAEPAG